MNWDEFFYKMAELVASKSKDRSTKCGSVIVGNGNTVLSLGFNGFPRKVNDDIDSMHDRPRKYFFFEHSERNSIYAAAKNGIKLDGSSIHLSGGGLPCADCARAIIQAGIIEIVYRDIPFKGKGNWKESMDAAKEMLLEAGVKLTRLDESFKRIEEK
jgi:dCMP deaminase